MGCSVCNHRTHAQQSCSGIQWFTEYCNGLISDKQVINVGDWLMPRLPTLILCLPWNMKPRYDCSPFQLTSYIEISIYSVFQITHSSLCLGHNNTVVDINVQKKLKEISDCLIFWCEWITGAYWSDWTMILIVHYENFPKYYVLLHGCWIHSRALHCLLMKLQIKFTS